MEFISIFFIIMSLIVLVYLFILLKSNKRIPILIEVFYLGAYLFVFTIFLFPQILNFIERIFGLDSAINFFVYLSIFISYLLIFFLYQKTEQQRVEITKLTREIAFINNKLEKKKK